MSRVLSATFRDDYFATARDGSASARLREAGLSGRLGEWTKSLTTTVVEACGAIGLRASGKGHELDLLPVPRSEYLALDVTAFAEGPRRWLYPTLVAELENQ